MHRICVYCGSSAGFDPVFASAAESVGRLLAKRGLDVVYGGGSVGLMGALADAALAAGGKVTGVIPRLLVQMEKEHRGLSRLIEVETMHERKQTMADLSDAFIALPGGIGTLEEIIEVFTWQQLGYHRKAVGLLNVAGYFDPLLEFMWRMEASGFLRAEHREALLVETDPEKLLDRIGHFSPQPFDKWL